jgi:ABC-2 type transport system ATP-binding protein
MLELLDVSKAFHGVAAVRSLTLRALPGQVIGLLGPNGSGKTTTVRMIVGLLKPSRGSIRWRGVSIADDPRPYLRNVGYVPEEPKLYTYLTAAEYLTLVGGLRDIAPDVLARRVDRYLELFELDTNRFAPLSSFSKGMRQRVLLAAALLHDPDVVVLDEPNSGLDVSYALVLRIVVERLKQRGKVIVYSSHVLDAVERVCDDIAILRRGEIVARGSTATLRELTRTQTLEQAFATVAIDRDPRQVGGDIADVATE